jgi:acetyltransferase-like isoleucine patch superfamily enzyme
MTLHDWIPPHLLAFARLLRARLRYRNCRIASGKIGRDVHLGASCAIYTNCEIGHGVRIGSYSYVNEGSIVASGTIGQFCSIGYACQIGMPEHPIDRISSSPFTYGRNNVFGLPAQWDEFPSPPVIGNDVWIGSRAIILQGVRVGDGAVIAAGAVVGIDVAPYTIVGGVPARVIRQRFAPDVVEKLVALRWWDNLETNREALRKLMAAADWRELLPPAGQPSRILCPR